MRVNVHGVLGLAAMVILIVIAVIEGGLYVVVATVLIVIYGGLVLFVSPLTEIGQEGNQGAKGGDTDYLRQLNLHYATARSAADVWLVGLHLAFALTILSLFFALPFKPLVNLAIFPLALLLGFSIVGLILTPTAEGPEWHAEMLISVAPPTLLLIVAEFRGWSPSLYIVLALIAYCVPILMLMSEYKFAPDVRPRPRWWLPWPLLTHSWTEVDEDRLSGLAPLRVYLVMTLLAIGLLVNVAGFVAPDGWDPDAFHNLLWICIFTGCVVVGAALPSFIVKGARF